MASMTSMSMSTVLTKSKAQVLRKQASRGAQLSFRLPAPFTSRGQRSACKSRKGQIIRSGLLDFLNPQTAPKTGARADELVSVLLDLARSTNGGAKARPETREQLEELAQQLQRFRPRAPTRSPLFPGTYKVLFTSNPSAPGGPVLRSAPGQAVFTGQQLRQTLEKPDVFLNEVAFKTLGLFPGTALQEGRWRALDGNRYVVDLDPAALKVAGNAGVSQQSEAVQRKFEVLYLDERVRVVRFLPETDSESEPQLFVFEREVEDAEDDVEEEEDEPEEEAAALPFLRGRGRAGLATEAERSYAQEASAGTKRIGRKAAVAPAQVPDAKSEEVKRREAVRAQLAEITEAYKDAQAQTRTALKQLKDFERESAQARRQSAPALDMVRVADATAEAAEQQLQAAREVAANADEQLKAASSALVGLERRVRQR